MYEAYTAVVGTIITNPQRRTISGGEEVISFRMASNARWLDRASGEWQDGGTLYLTVSCWRRMITGVGAALAKGDPVIAYGPLRTNQYVTKDGVERSDLEMRATALGPDLARCVVRFERPKGPQAEGPASGQANPDGNVRSLAAPGSRQEDSADDPGEDGSFFPKTDAAEPEPENLAG